MNKIETITKRQVRFAIDESPTLREAATMLGLSVTSLRVLRNQFDIGKVRCHRLFTPDDIRLIRALAEEYGLKSTEITGKFDDRTETIPVAAVYDVIHYRTYKDIE